MTMRAGAAIAVWLVSWAFALASLVIAWVAGLPREPLTGVFLSPAPVEMRASFDDIGVTVALVYGPVSALILARRPHPVGVILAIHAVGSGIAAFGVQYGLLGEQVDDLPLWGLFAFAAGWGFVPGTFMTAALPFLVTRTRIPRWHRVVIGVAAIIAFTAFVASLTQQSVPEPRNPLGVDLPAYQAILPGLYTALSFAAVGISVLSTLVLVARWARSSGRDRVGVVWLTLGHLFLTASYFALVLPEAFAPPRWVVDFGLVAPVLGQVLYPAAILVVVLGQRLWGIELVVSRIILWSLLTISGVVLYLVVVLVVPAVLPGATGLWLVTPIVIALAVQPLRNWLQHRIDRLIYGGAAEPAVMLARLGDRIGELEPGAAGLRELSDALRRVLRLGSVEIRSTSSPIVAESGRAGGDPVAIPLERRERRIGELIVRPVDGQRLDRRTRAVLADVAGLVAAAVQLVEANLVLEQARGDLVHRRAEERRKIRRELHDGLGPSLAGIGFGLAAAANLVTSDRVKAEQLIAELADDLARRVREVRDLADEITPSPLDEGDLAGALEAIAARFGAVGPSIRTTVHAGPPLPPELERGLFLIAAEALSNAVRHADATRIDVTVSWNSARGQIELVVCDDGIGIRADAPRGVGLISMRERADEAGGTLEVHTGSSGTIVRARIAVRAPAGERIEDMAL